MLPLLIVMSKIIKHTFEIPNLTVENGELVEGKPTKLTYTFTLLFKGFGLFEEIHGKSLFSAMLEMYGEDGDVGNAKNLFKTPVIKDLACASYVKIEGNKFHNNRATVEEFKKSPAYQLVENDTEFITKMSQMAAECLYDTQKQKNKTQNEVNRPKK